MAEQNEVSSKQPPKSSSRRTKAATSSTSSTSSKEASRKVTTFQKKPTSSVRIEFRADPLDAMLTQGIVKIKKARHERATSSSVNQQAQRLGLLAFAALTGPSPDNGLYADQFTAEQLADLLRVETLGLADFQQKVGKPLYPAQSSLVLASQLATPNVSPSPSITPSDTPVEMNKSGAKAVGGLGAGMLRKRKPPPSESSSEENSPNGG